MHFNIVCHNLISFDIIWCNVIYLNIIKCYKNAIKCYSLKAAQTLQMAYQGTWHFYLTCANSPSGLPPSHEIIMYSIYSDHSQNKPDDIKGQIQDLNKLILDYAVNNVYNEAVAYKHYIRDQSTLAMPFDRSLQNDRDYKHLEHKNFM